MICPAATLDRPPSRVNTFRLPFFNALTMGQLMPRRFVMHCKQFCLPTCQYDFETFRSCESSRSATGRDFTSLEKAWRSYFTTRFNIARRASQPTAQRHVAPLAAWPQRASALDSFRPLMKNTIISNILNMRVGFDENS
jgi:hypothetical protein